MTSTLVVLHRREVFKNHEGRGPQSTSVTVTGALASLWIHAARRGSRARMENRAGKAAGETEGERPKGQG